MTLALWENGNQRIGISEYGSGYMVTPSVWDGTKTQVIGAKKFKTLRGANNHVVKLIETSKEIGLRGEYKKVEVVS